MVRIRLKSVFMLNEQMMNSTPGFDEIFILIGSNKMSNRTTKNSKLSFYMYNKLSINHLTSHQYLRQVFKLMLTRWRSPPMKSMLFEYQSIRDWTSSIDSRTYLSFRVCTFVSIIFNQLIATLRENLEIAAV